MLNEILRRYPHLIDQDCGQCSLPLDLCDCDKTEQERENDTIEAVLTTCAYEMVIGRIDRELEKVYN